MAERRHPQVVNIEEVEAQERLTGTKLGGRMRWLGRTAGGKGLGCTLYEVPPGRAAFPRHAHFANEEAIYVLDGEGTLRMGDQEVKLRPGDYAALLPGREHAHQLRNTGTATLRYLCMSTMIATELVIYPDSGKVGVMAYTALDKPPAIRAIFRENNQVDYFDGEDTGEKK